MWPEMTTDWITSGSDAAISISGHTKKELHIGSSSIQLGVPENIGLAFGITILT